MIFDIITLFPEMFASVFEASILKRAKDKGLIKIKLHNLRDWATDKHKTVDDTPYGGGAGMVIRVDIVDKCLNDLKKLKMKNEKLKIILLTPQGENFRQAKARELSKLDRMILICGHYEGFDQRIHDHLVDEEMSIGDYVLTGGEIPAMAVTDTVARLVPGVIKDESLRDESFSEIERPTPLISFSSKTNKKSVSPIYPPKNSSEFLGARLGEKFEDEIFLEYPQYTKPAEYKGWKVPEVLLSGNHGEIKKWREKMLKKRAPH